MNYSSIFENYNNCKKILSRILESNDNLYIKKILDNIEDKTISFIVNTQYLYLYQKKMNILKYNKSLNIYNIENNIDIVLNENIMDYIDNMSNNELILLLLNLDKKKVNNIKLLLEENKEIKNIELVDIDLLHSNYNDEIENIINKTAEITSDKIVEKIASLGSNISLNKEIYEEDDDEEDNLEEDNIEEDDEDDEEDIEEININKEMNKIKEYEKQYPEEDKKNEIVELSDYDLNLLDKL